jgi:hypothetical protein
MDLKPSEMGEWLKAKTAMIRFWNLAGISSRHKNRNTSGGEWRQTTKESK